MTGRTFLRFGVFPAVATVGGAGLAVIVIGGGPERHQAGLWLIAVAVGVLMAISLVADVLTLRRERREARAAQTEGKTFREYLSEREKRMKGGDDTR